jgi:hypothetical protein
LSKERFIKHPDLLSATISIAVVDPSWAQEAYLKAPNAEANDFFGVSVSVSSDTIAVGAIGEDSNQTTITNGTTASANNSATNAGAVYVFVRK